MLWISKKIPRPKSNYQRML